MILDRLLPVLLTVALLLAAVGIIRRIRLWRAGRPEKVALLAGLLAMPRRYLVDLHHVVARDKVMSNTHVATAGGFVLSMLLILAVHLFGIHSRWLAGALLGRWR
ncbi:Domain of uncharacterised function (DUF3483) [Serratia rubidaea]|uniref:Domain of uncharacterized function (DUF3483) n=1 Tax=Serratia rubidaea TaxID=61652 RepID=A0A3S4HX96_SERRU|nr:Domain of uncharacterised function (DUF3483) [Serratia rubidaea]